MHRSRTIAVRLVSVLLVTAACTSEGDGSEPTSPEARHLQGGTLRIGVSDAAVLDGLLGSDLDPQRNYVSPTWELFRCCLLRTLYAYNGKPTEEGGAEPQPDLASGVAEVSADGLTWTFRLRRGIYYAPPLDDTPIVALDIVRALERTARVGSERTYRFYYFPIRGFKDYGAGRADTISGLQTPDDRTLVVQLEEVTSDLPYRFAMPATAPIPEGADEGHDGDYGRFLVASGPYRVEGSGDIDFTLPPDQQEPAAGFVPPTLSADEPPVIEDPGSLVLVRNPSWDPSADPLRAAYADRIEFSLGGLDDEEISRRVDVATTDLLYPGNSPFEQVAQYRNDPTLSDRLYVHAENSLWGVTMNVALPPFDDLHVRRAVAHAIDKARLVELLSEPPYGPFGFSFGEVATHLSPDALGARLLRAFDPYPYDPPAALEEMQASVYDRDGDGRCDAPACRGIRALVMDAGVLPLQAKAIRDDLAEIGIELVLRVVPQTGFFGDFETLEFDGTIHDPRAQVAMGIAYPWLADYPDGGGWFPALFDDPGTARADVSLVGATRAELRQWGYEVTSVPSINDRVQVCMESRGVSRTECWVELDQHVMTEVVPWVPYLFGAHAQVVSERVVAYSYAQWPGGPALDRIALAPGSD
jgi:peptide/nickel transport system substrate-binding protein